jgi:hypothetical protein
MSHLERKKNRVSPEFAQVMGRPAGLPEFDRAVAPADLLVNPDQSIHRVDRVPGRPGFNNTSFGIAVKMLFVKFLI